MRCRSFALSLALPLIVGTPVGVTLAQETTCSDLERAAIELRIVGTSSDLARGIEADLRAGLSRRDIAVCPERPGSQSLARVSVQAADPDAAQVSIAIVDEVTDKRVERSLALQDLPRDGRPLAIAVAAEELLRASWAELALASAKPKATPPPIEAVVLTGPEQDRPDRAEQPSPANYELSIAAGLEGYGAGQTQIGADLGLRRRIVGIWSAELGLSARAGVEHESPRGGISSFAWGPSLSSVFEVLGGEVGFVELEGGIRLLHVRFDGDASPGARASELEGWAVIPRGGIRAGLSLSPALRVRARVGAGAPIAAVIATDGGDDATGVGGYELGAGIGAGVLF